MKFMKKGILTISLLIIFHLLFSCTNKCTLEGTWCFMDSTFYYTEVYFFGDFATSCSEIYELNPKLYYKANDSIITTYHYEESTDGIKILDLFSQMKYSFLSENELLIKGMKYTDTMKRIDLDLKSVPSFAETYDYEKFIKEFKTRASDY